MRILHVSLGLPPFRSGGLTYYAMDLMKAQLRLGAELQLLYPGHFSIKRGLHISQKANFGFMVFEIVNPLPIPIPFGIRKPRAFMKPADVSIFLNFLKQQAPDIIHVHTIMGIHREFFQAAKTLGIKLVFTTHDYFGLCVKTIFINQQHQPCDGPDAAKCAMCCARAGVPTSFIYLMQTDAYQTLKHTWLMKIIRLYQRKVLTPGITASTDKSVVSPIQINEYENIYNYYQSIHEMLDLFHFNSKQSKEIYARFLHPRGEIIPITLDDIDDRRASIVYRKETGILRIGYIGSRDSYKGSALLAAAFRILIMHGLRTWEAHFYGDDYSELEKSFYGKVISHGRYERNNIDKVFQSMDILVVPSICKETYSLVVLAALSFGLPVFVSENVGAKDLLSDAPISVRFQPNPEALFILLKEIMSRPDILNQYRCWIIHKTLPFDMNDHARKIVQLYNCNP